MKKLSLAIILVIVIGLPFSLHGKCQRSDAGPVLQVALDVSCAVQWVGHEAKWLGRKIKHIAVYIVRGLD